MNLNICVTDEEIEHDLTGLQTQDPLQCVGAQSGHWVSGHMVFPNAYIDLSPNLLGTMLEPMRQ